MAVEVNGFNGAVWRYEAATAWGINDADRLVVLKAFPDDEASEVEVAELTLAVHNVGQWRRVAHVD